MNKSQADVEITLTDKLTVSFFLQVSLLVLAYFTAVVLSQTLVHFSPSTGLNLHNTPVAAGFAYAFRAPGIPRARSLDSFPSPAIVGYPANRYETTKKVTEYVSPSTKPNVVPVYYPAPVEEEPRSKQLNAIDIIPEVVKTQYHSQDELGQYAYGYVHNGASHHEERTADGGVIGSYSYYDNDGKKQSANYVADRYGYRIEASNLPDSALTPVKPTPEVEAATYAHLRAVAEAKQRKQLGRHIHVGIGETPEVAAARKAHLAAFNKIKKEHSNKDHFKRKYTKRWRRSASYPHQTSFQQVPLYEHAGPHVSHYSHSSVQHFPVAPTPEVQLATHQHLQALTAAHKYGGNVHVGIPDTPAVAAARDAHFYAYDKIAREHGKRWKRSASRFRSHNSAHYHKQNHAPSFHSYFTPVQPTPEVQAATYAHFKAKDQVYRYGSHAHLGVPDTPYVAAAKDAHLHALHHARKQHAKLW